MKGGSLKFWKCLRHQYALNLGIRWVRHSTSVRHSMTTSERVLEWWIHWRSSPLPYGWECVWLCLCLCESICLTICVCGSLWVCFTLTDRLWVFGCLFGSGCQCFIVCVWVCVTVSVCVSVSMLSWHWVWLSKCVCLSVTGLVCLGVFCLCIWVFMLSWRCGLWKIL